MPFFCVLPSDNINILKWSDSGAQDKFALRSCAPYAASGHNYHRNCQKKTTTERKPVEQKSNHEKKYNARTLTGEREACRFRRMSAVESATLKGWHWAGIFWLNKTKTRHNLTLNGALSSLMTMKMPRFKWERSESIIKTPKSDGSSYKRAQLNLLCWQCSALHSV